MEIQRVEYRMNHCRQNDSDAEPCLNGVPLALPVWSAWWRVGEDEAVVFLTICFALQFAKIFTINRLTPTPLASIMLKCPQAERAGMAELADALDSGSSDRKVMQVQVLFPALKQQGARKGAFFVGSTNFLCGLTA